MASPAEQLQAAKTLVRREVLRQVYVPLRVIAARLMLYYIPHYKGFDRPWISVRNAVAALRDSGAIMPEKVGDENWYHLPRTKPEKLQLARETQPPVYNAWSNVLPRGGGHAEVLWRLAFEAEGWVVPDKAVQVRCPHSSRALHAERHEIDVYATLGRSYTVACEVKNGAAEGWVDPELPSEVKLTKQQHMVLHHFEAMNELGLVPMLAAPFVDPSFYRFQARHGGVHARYLYHVFDPRDAKVAAAVKETFRIGHVWAEPSPPQNFRLFVRRLPQMIEKTREVGRRMEEAMKEADEERESFEPDLDDH